MQENNRLNIMFGRIQVRDSKNKVKTIDNAVFTENATIYKRMPILKVIEVKVVGTTNYPFNVK